MGSNLIESIDYTCKLFMRIVMFALFGLFFSYACDVDPIKGYKIIILFAIIGALISAGDVIKKGFIAYINFKLEW